MADELRELLERFLAGTADRRDLRLFVASFDWDDAGAEARRLQPHIAELDLLLEEVGEGFREEAELRASARHALEAATGPVRIAMGSGIEDEAPSGSENRTEEDSFVRLTA